MNTSPLDHSLWVKVGQTVSNLFIGSNRVIVCSESAIGRSEVYFFVKDFSILFRCSVATMLKKILLVVKLQQQYVLLHRWNIWVHLNSPLKRSDSFLSRCLCFTQDARGKSFATASVKLSTEPFDRNLCNSVLI